MKRVSCGGQIPSPRLMVAYVKEARLLNADTWLVGLLISFSTIDPVRQVGAPGILGQPAPHLVPPPCIAGAGEESVGHLGLGNKHTSESTDWRLKDFRRIGRFVGYGDHCRRWRWCR